MIKVGDQPEDVVLQDQTGAEVSLASFRGAPLVLFFYPKASTPGCTTEACAFRDLAAEFGEKGVQILGMSADTVRRQSNFATKHELPYPLLADVDHKVLEPWGIWAEKKNYGRTYMGIIRTTVLLNAEGVVTKVWSPVRVKGHVDAVLAEVTSQFGS